MSNARPRGPMGGHGGGMSAEKAKDFKTAMKRLLSYMKRYRIQLMCMIVFAIGSTVFNIIGPKVLGKATTELYSGLVSKINGGSGIDFGKIISFVGAGTVRSQCAVFPDSGIYYDGNFQ